MPLKTILIFLMGTLSTYVFAIPQDQSIDYLIMGNNSPWTSDNKGFYTTSNAANEDGSIIHEKGYILSFEFNALNKCMPAISFIIMKGKSLGAAKKSFISDRDEYTILIDEQHYLPKQSIGTIYTNGAGYIGVFNIKPSALLEANVIAPLIMNRAQQRVVGAPFKRRKGQYGLIRNEYQNCMLKISKSNPR